MSDLHHLKSQLKVLRGEALEHLRGAADSQKLYEVKTHYMGLKSPLHRIAREMKTLSPADRPSVGLLFNEVKKELTQVYQSLYDQMKARELDQKIHQGGGLDMTLPGPPPPKASLHPVQQMIVKTVEIFKSAGFCVRTGPLIESDWNNFQALNIGPNHPARDEQDTFYIDKHHVLRTHTSPIQVRAMLSGSPPLACLAPGKVFRRDNDVSHSPTFHQMEGMLIDRSVSLAHLKGLLSHFIREMFGSRVKTRFRPSYFPFTEPSAEYDCSCPLCKGEGCSLCKHSGWVEIGGCGLMHPRVLGLSHIDPDRWEGLAFGLGMERLAIIYYGIPHIRLFFDNQIPFLEQF